MSTTTPNLGLALPEGSDRINPTSFNDFGNDFSALDTAQARLAVCSTAAATVAKVATLDGFKLHPGALIACVMTYANTVASPTLNVNGTGAKAIYQGGAAMTVARSWAAGDVLTLAYDGTEWVVCDSGSYRLQDSISKRTYITLTAVEGGPDISNISAYRQAGRVYVEGFFSASTVNTNAEVLTGLPVPPSLVRCNCGWSNKSGIAQITTAGNLEIMTNAAGYICLDCSYFPA